MSELSPAIKWYTGEIVLKFGSEPVARLKCTAKYVDTIMNSHGLFYSVYYAVALTI